MASHSGDASGGGSSTTRVLRERRSLLSSTGDVKALPSCLRDDDNQLQRGEGGLTSLIHQRSKNSSDPSFKVSSPQLRLTNTNQDSDNLDRKPDSDQRDSQDAGGVARFAKQPTSQDSKHKEQQLWLRLEDVMTAKQTQVQRVMEEFGIADVYPASDALEEQVWKVVQGELTMQEVADLV